MGAYSVAVCDQWRCKEAEVGEKQSWRGPQWGPGTKPPEAEKHDMNFALRITLVWMHIAPSILRIRLSSSQRLWLDF